MAPIENPAIILDVGTGSGRWAIEVAREFKDTNVIGMDLSPISPSSAVPENCKFIIGDLTKGLNFDTGSLDLVHSRYPLIIILPLTYQSYQCWNQKGSMATVFKGSSPCFETWKWMGSVYRTSWPQDFGRGQCS